MEQLFLKGNFNLRQTKVANKVTPIYYVINVNGKQYKFATGVKVICSQWDKEKQQATESVKQSKADNRNNKVANEVLEKYKDSFAQYLDYLAVNEETPNYKTLRRFIYMEETKINPIDVFKTAFDKLISELSNDGTINQYRNYYNAFADYIKDKTDMSVFNQYGVNDYKKYLQKKGDSVNNINKKVGFLVRIINEYLCVDSDYLYLNLQKVSFTTLKDKRTKDEKGRFPLTENEVSKIAHLQINDEDTFSFEDVAPKSEDGITNNKYRSKKTGKELKEYRDIFVLQCDCGQRVSDLKQFLKGDYTETTYNGSTYFEIKTKKSGYKQSAFIRKTATVERFLETYKNGFSVNIDILDNSNSYYNLAIRKLCQLANINRIIEYSDSKGVSHKEPLYYKITSHDARHTFITNMIIKGFSPDVLCWLTGHNDDTMIKSIYTHLSKSDKLNSIEKELAKIEKKSVNKDGLQELFAYDELKKVQSTLKNNADGYHTQSAKTAITKIKDVSLLSKYNTIDKEKVLELEPIIFDLSYYFKDFDLYNSFEYKLKHFGLIDSITSYEDMIIRFNDYSELIQKIKEETELKEYLERT